MPINKTASVGLKSKAMKLNYSEIKLEFFKYLAELSKIDVDLDKLDDVSIFSYSTDFKDFVSDKYNLDESIFSFDLNDILSMSFDGNKFTDKTASDESLFALDFLNDLFKDEDVKKAIDADGNGKLSDEEVDNFFSTISGLDGKADDVSLSDVKNAFAQIKSGDFKLGETPETPEAPSGPSGPSGPSNPTNPTNPTDPTTPTDPGTDTQEANLASMTVEQLNNERTTAQAARDEQIALLSEINEGKGPVADAKTAMDEAYTKMQTELEKLDSELAQQYNEAKVDREAKEKDLADNEAAITKKTAEKSDAQADLDNATQNVESIKSCISSLESQKSSAETEEEKAAIQAKIDAAQTKLEQAEQAKTDAQTNLDTKTQELQELEDKTPGLQEALEAAKTKEAELETKVNELANKEGNEAFKALKDDYDTKKAAYETAKTEAINTVKQAIQEKQAYIDKINAQIPVTQKAENEKEFRPDSVETAIEDKVAAIGGNAKDLTITQAADGSYNVTEKTQDGVEVKYTFDKDGNMTSYQNGMGTFKANGDSTTISGDALRKWAKGIDSYTINASLEDIVSQIRQSSPQAESLINAALGSYQASGLAGMTDICVKYANYVLTQFGHPIGQYSDDVKAQNKEISLSEAKTGDVYINNRHTGIVLLHITDRNGKEVFLTADGTNSGVYLNVRDGKDESLARGARIFKGLTA